MARLPDLGADRKPVHSRHHNIENAEIRRFLTERLKQRLAVPKALHLIPLFFQKIFYQKTDIFFIIRHIDQLCHSCSSCIFIVCLSPPYMPVHSGMHDSGLFLLC